MAVPFAPPLTREFPAIDQLLSVTPVQSFWDAVAKAVAKDDADVVRGALEPCGYQAGIIRK